MCYSWLPSLACRGNTDDLIWRLDVASGAVVCRRWLQSHAAPVISALLWVWMDVRPPLKSRCKGASSSRNICGGKMFFCVCNFFGRLVVHKGKIKLNSCSFTVCVDWKMQLWPGQSWARAEGSVWVKVGECTQSNCTWGWRLGDNS